MNRNIVVAALNNEDTKWLAEVSGWTPHVFTIFHPAGRESHAILSHIISRYSRIEEEDEIVFCQGDPFSHHFDFIDCVMNRPEVTHYGPVIECDKMAGPHYKANLDAWCEIFGLEARPTYRFSAGAQYRVTGAQILSRQIELYDAMLSLTEVNPMTPWVYERLWPVIWGMEL